jgi:hypothetical protein
MTPDPIEAIPAEVDEGERIFSAWYPAPTEEHVAAALQTDDPATALVPEPDDTESWEKWAVGLLAAGATSVALDAAKSTAWLLARRAFLISTLTDTTRRGVQAQIDLDPSPAAIVRAYGIPATRINTLAADPSRASALLAERWRLVSDGETTATFAAGAIEAAAQAVADGTLPPGTEIEWNARYTSNICEECSFLDGQRQPHRSGTCSHATQWPTPPRGGCPFAFQTISRIHLQTSRPRCSDSRLGAAWPRLLEAQPQKKQRAA